MSKEIDSKKLLVHQVFQRFYRIPEYQRPYVWSVDQVNDLLDDVNQACSANPDSQYFIGSLVLHRKEKTEGEIKYEEFDLLDGQQRLTTLLLITAVVRDLTPTSNESRIKSCKESIYQMAIPDDNIPERIRVIYNIREDVQNFVNDFVKTDGGTNRVVELEKLIEIKKEDEDEVDLSIKNMANAILTIRKYFSNNGNLDSFYKFMRSNVLLIYVATDELEDAFRLFTVMNNRGVKLRSSDILKAENLSKVPLEKDMKQFAKDWEEIESYFGEDFDNFLSHLRTIKVKAKANLTLLKEFEDNIYNPREYDRTTKIYTPKTPLLKKGKETFDFIKTNYDNYRKLFDHINYDYDNSFKFINLLSIMQKGFEADYWIAPILRFYELNHHI